MRNAIIAITLMLAAPSLADAKPRGSSAEVASANAASANAKLELKRARAAAKLAAHRVKLAKARVAGLKTRQRLAHEQWIADCIHERTGPVGGISELDAADICTAEAPAGDELVDE